MNWNKSNEDKIQKTRDLPIYDYFEALQKEYVVMEIRSKIYPTSKDKKYYKDIMQHKQDKIVDIARRNDLLCIFNDTKTKAELESLIIRKRGLPNFIYRDQMARDRYELEDIEHYFLPDTDVKVYLSTDDKDFELGVIQSFDIHTMTVSVRLRGGRELKSSTNNVTRIL